MQTREITFYKKSLTQQQAQHYGRLHRGISPYRINYTLLFVFIFSYLVMMTLAILMLTGAWSLFFATTISCCFLYGGAQLFWRAKWQALFALHAFNTTPKMVTADLDGLTYFHTEGKKKPDTQPWTDFQEWRASQTMVILYYRHKSTQEIFIRQNFATQDDWHVFLSLVRWSIPHGYSSIIHKA